MRRLRRRGSVFRAPCADVCACCVAGCRAQEHRTLLLDALDATDLRRLWLLARSLCRAPFTAARAHRTDLPSRAPQAGRRYGASDAALAGALGAACGALDILPRGDSDDQDEEWHVYAASAPALPPPFRRARLLLFPAGGAGGDALGGRVAAARRPGSPGGMLGSVLDRFSPGYFSAYQCDAVPASGEPCDAVLDWGVAGAPPALLPQEIPSGAATDAACARVGIALPRVRTPRWPAAGLRAYLRPVGPGALIAAAWRGDGGIDAAADADAAAAAEADEPAFTFLMLRVEK
jgi:hypothetical protein